MTLRLRAGFELKHSSGLSFLAESEGTLGIVNDYNAFPFTIANSQRRPQFATVADPMNIELNRLQLQYRSAKATVTVGRQRIALDDQRWIGAAAWRQNEQTFDAVRGEARIGPLNLDAAYASSQRTVFGIDAGPRQSFDGDFIMLGAGAKAGPVAVKGFAYLLDYDNALFAANSSQTYGVRATATLPVGRIVKANLAGSCARQSDYGGNPASYSADYAALQAALVVKDLTVTGGWELLGSDNGRAVQTPMASLHPFNGWADMFLTTPNTGLKDYYGSLAYRFSGVKALPGLNASLAYHRFDSATGGLHYGDEWDASLGFKLGRATILAKYADYHAEQMATDTRKVWLQVEFGY
ncbi:alginate export family protein [Novosphingobium cyanobacteriorum]|uniref:Alginate export family protein n=1 Tax=Novosphingobium cyanobacteriorum TaxID=3024215 RepID=A0ABT6CNJ4_9SPHN|nr:alginate export family protein [Novosphingobium cyanobacteriorum]MDF8335467.1 alginate export family protein [Novosphingobium cyanobacteriorum]